MYVFIELKMLETTESICNKLYAHSSRDSGSVYTFIFQHLRRLDIEI